MKSLMAWHKDKIDCVANHFNLSNYQLLWIAGIKGVALGYVSGTYL